MILSLDFCHDIYFQHFDITILPPARFMLYAYRFSITFTLIDASFRRMLIFHAYADAVSPLPAPAITLRLRLFRR